MALEERRFLDSISVDKTLLLAESQGKRRILDELSGDGLRAQVTAWLKEQCQPKKN